MDRRWDVPSRVPQCSRSTAVPAETARSDYAADSSEEPPTAFSGPSVECSSMCAD